VLPRLSPSRLPVARAAACAAFVLGSSAAVGVSALCSYGVRTATALTAAALLLRAARRRDGLSRSRWLFAMALLVGSASGGTAAIHEMVTGSTGSAGGLDDWLELSYVPFAVAGLFAVPGSPGGRWRTVADGTVAAGALWFIAVTLIVEPQHLGDGLPTGARLTTFGYVLLPAFVVASLLSVLPRAAREARPFLGRIGTGTALLATSDLCFSLATWRGSYDPAGAIAAMNQAGLALVLVAAVTSRTPERPPTVGRGRAGSMGSVEAVLPYAPLAAALVVAVTQYAAGSVFTRAQMLPLMVIGAAVVVRHAAAARDHGRLVSTLEASERAARAEALRDPLTGLANRTAFADHLASRLTDPAAHPVAVALLDLNDFKDVNDSHGHDTGDRLLQGCAERLVAAAPDGSVVARLGGDEFALAQANAGDGGKRLVEAVAAAFDTPIVIGQRRFTVRPSIGVVVDERAAGRAVARDATQLLAHADVAMYQAKAAKAVHTTPAVILTGAARARAAGLIRLRDEISAPDLRQFRVVYQPVVDLSNGEIRGVEALLRWRHPDLGEISPAEFIPLAEQVGSVTVLGEHVLSTAAADLARWQTLAGAPRLAVGVNLSPRQLDDPGLADRVLQLVTVHGLAADQLVLEITEGALMHDLDEAVGLVTELRAGGLSVAVDDFGTGYSSLRYLSRFPVDVVKIDREFIQALPTAQRTATLVRSVVEMAGALDLQTVAEGIETVEQLRATQLLGCELGQGFLFSRPVAADAIAELLSTGHTFPVGADPLRPSLDARPADRRTAVVTAHD
jgi:diguanylate cyclase (GGDEF)-like protein